MKKRSHSKVQKKANKPKQKSNKLRFKSTSSHPRKPNQNKPSISTLSDSYFSSPSPSSEEQEPVRNPPPSRPILTASTPDFIEWGPSINGYRFIGIRGQTHHYEKRNKLVNESERTNHTANYNWSYMDFPKYESHAKIDPLEIKFGINSDKVFTYDEYFKRWEHIKQEGLRDVIFPVADQERVDLNKETVSGFLRTSTGDLANVLKIERIRWHPDKMLRTLMIDVNDALYERLKVNITRTFQIINELWEERK